ncbi:ATP-binding protein [Novosphingobium sp.]|uniref:ATP-binding protein n=1 Tax=Novosphingobium sp. TaxID=1874826 RepID=UPI0038BBD9C1
MTRWRPFRRFGLPERLLAILLLVTAVDFTANTLVFDQAGTFALHQDDAARIAEHLTLASRAIEQTPVAERAKAAQHLSSPHFVLGWKPAGERQTASVPEHLDALRTPVVQIAPELAQHGLRLTMDARKSGENVDGALVLADRSVLEFRTHASKAWGLSAGRLSLLLLPTLMLVLLAWALFRVTLRPLALLIDGTRRVGTASPREIPERGTEEIRLLIRAFNRMQQRVHRTMQQRTQSMLAIGHDLRTPLARLRLRLEGAGLPDDQRDALTGDIEEMQSLLESLQAYVDAGADALPAERVDLAAMAATLVDNAADHGGDATYAGADALPVMARPASIRRAIANLVENALHYGGNAQVSVVRDGADAVVTVADDGPGIPEKRMDDVLQPFVRLDTARGRDTPGMGLGLAIVRRAVKLEGGQLTLANRPEGGLIVTIRLPSAALTDGNNRASR